MRKPLLSVGRVCDEGNRVIFTRDGGHIDHESSGDKVPFSRINNIYTMDVATVPEPYCIRLGIK